MLASVEGDYFIIAFLPGLAARRRRCVISHL